VTLVRVYFLSALILVTPNALLLADQNSPASAKQAVEDRYEQERAAGAEHPAPKNPDPYPIGPETPWQDKVMRCINSGPFSALSGLSQSIAKYDPTSHKPLQGNATVQDFSKICLILRDEIYPGDNRLLRSEGTARLIKDPHPEACLGDVQEVCSGERYLAIGNGVITLLAKSVDPDVPDIEYKLNIMKSSKSGTVQHGRDDKALAIDASEQSTLSVKLPIYVEEKGGRDMNAEAWALGKGIAANFPNEKPGKHSCGADPCEDELNLRDGKPYITDAQTGGGNSSWSDEHCEISLRYAASLLTGSGQGTLSLSLQKITGSTFDTPLGPHIDLFRADLVGTDRHKIGELVCRTGLKEDEGFFEFTTTFADLDSMLGHDRLQLHLVENGTPPLK
jgi:hypothetical protein